MRWFKRFFHNIFSAIHKITLAEMRVRDNFLIKYLNFIPYWVRPNHLTIVRLALSGVFFLPRQVIGGGTALVLLAFGGLTDIIDGVLARKRDQITTLGEILDPIADKVLALGALWYLFSYGLINQTLFIHIILPELVLLAYAIWYLFDRRVKHPEPNIIARLKFTGYIFALIVLMISLLLGPILWMNYLGWGLIVLSIVLSWISQIVYAQDVISDFRAKVAAGEGGTN